MSNNPNSSSRLITCPDCKGTGLWTDIRDGSQPFANQCCNWCRGAGTVGSKSDAERAWAVHVMQRAINDQAHHGARLHADGMGSITEADLHGPDAEIVRSAFYDWSHVRDSSARAWCAMADELRQHGYGPEA